MANAPRLPFEFLGFADNVALYVEQLEKLASKMREATEENNRLLDDGTYAAALDPNGTLGPPKRREPVPHFNFARSGIRWSVCNGPPSPTRRRQLKALHRTLKRTKCCTRANAC